MSNTKFEAGDIVLRIGPSVEEVKHGEHYRVVKQEGLSNLLLEGIEKGYDPVNFRVTGPKSQAPQADSTKASKHDSAKADVSLVPREALEAAARALMVGEKKYGRYNYYKGHKVSQLIAAMMRHATAYMDGEENDPQDGQPHLGSVIACAAMILKQQALGTSIDDRYGKEKKDENDKK